MIKRLYILLIMFFGIVTTSHAVLKEDSIANTLSLLRQELVKYHDEFSAKQAASVSSNRRVFSVLMETVKRSNQNALMLYSQKDGYVFDLTYACHEAIQQYHEFEKQITPFKNFVGKADGEVERYDSLINCLRSMPENILGKQAKMDRSVCLAVAVNTRRMLVENQKQLSEYIYYYQATENRLRNLDDYANKRYNQIQNSIFRNGGDSYFSILSRLGAYLSQTKESIDGKYFQKTKVQSQWDARIIVGLFFVIIIYGIIAILINQLIVRLIVTRLIQHGRLQGIAEWFMQKRFCIILASTVVTFALILGLVHLTSQQNFIIMASNLLVEFAWLLSVILISLLIRAKAEHVKSAFRIYSPLIVNGFVVISFRIILIPNDLVNLIFPPILLVCALWQWNVILRHRKNVDMNDKYYAYISQCIFIVSLVSSMIGYTLLSVQILIWWIMQLTCILTITCIRDWYNELSKRKHLKELPVTKNWHYNFFSNVMLPVAGFFSLLLSVYWAADVFNLSQLAKEKFVEYFVDINELRLSVCNIYVVIILWFIFKYINDTTKAFVSLFYRKTSPETADSRIGMINNVLQVVVWGAWLLISLAIMRINNSWILVIGGGLSTGIGFASKDILENIYYGLSLMAGRIRIGDMIVCDGIRGRVTSISYTSTMLTATDGSVIAFTNSQLFAKNYQNMTRNHGWECHVLDVGVAYGTDVRKCKQLLLDAVSQLDCINKEKGVKVVLKGLGDSALVLKVLVWLRVETQYADDGIVLECIYNTLNDNKIEIPFPQTDVHMKQ